MNRTTRTAATTFAAATCLATAAVVLGSAGGGYAAATTSSAYGISADGPIPVEKTPYVESTDGSPQSTGGGKVPDNPLVSGEIATLTAGNGKAAVKLVDATIGQGLPQPPAELLAFCQQLPDQGAPDLPDNPLPDPGLPIPIPSPSDLPADSLRELCELVLTPPDSLVSADVVQVSCNGDQGRVRVVGLEVAGQKVPVPDPEPNTSIPDNPLIGLTVNKQTRNADGSFTVSGVEVTLGGTQTVTLGSATCGARVPAVADTSGPAPAPAPSPVQRNAPVTG
jgi:hypothetical protein